MTDQPLPQAPNEQRGTPAPVDLPVVPLTPAPRDVSPEWAAAALRHLVAQGWPVERARAACKARRVELYAHFIIGHEPEIAADAVLDGVSP
jgi:hypothetical protein